MSGLTNFNSDLFGAEHLIIEDDQAHIDIKARRNFGAQIKSFTVNYEQRLHAKGRDAFAMRPLWRVTCSVNDEPENLMILPPMDESIADKMMLFRVVDGALPTAESQADYDKVLSDLIADIPALLTYLLSWEIPPDTASTRFGVTHFHHPEILQALDERNPEYQLLTLIDRVIFGQQIIEWTGTATELKEVLFDATGFDAAEARNLLSKWAAGTGVYLSRLSKSQPQRVSKIPRSSGRFSQSWEIKA